MRPLDQLLRAERLGLLFSGGASRCIFQVGVVETLLALGVRPSVCLGISGGAWNAAAVAVGNAARLRSYWKFFSRMPAFDIRNLVRERSVFRWRRLHERAFRRYVSAERLRSPDTLPLYVAATRLADKKLELFDVRQADDPLQVMLASNYLPPFYTHAPQVNGDRYGDAGFVDSLPYELLFERGCDTVVVLSQKGVCEGGLFRHIDDPDHVIPARHRQNVVVIRPLHMLDLAFLERRWPQLAAVADLGALRAHDVLLGEDGEPAGCHHGRRPTWYIARLRQLSRTLRNRFSEVR